MDMAPLILILTPILLPVITGIGVDPVHFGMIMLVNLGIGLITPPVGAVLFVGSAIGKVSIESTVKALLPFYLALFLVLMAVTYIPAISLWLPSVVLYLKPGPPCGPGFSLRMDPAHGCSLLCCPLVPTQTGHRVAGPAGLFIRRQPHRRSHRLR
jgi:hypothetical protein